MTRLSRFFNWLSHRDKHESRILTLSYWLQRKGITITPFHLVLEGTGLLSGTGNKRAGMEKLPKGYKFVILKEKDVALIAHMPGRYIFEEELLKRLADGNICLAIQHKKKIASFAWCDFKKCNSVTYHFALQKGQAYIFDAFTMNEYRGMGLAVKLRLHIHNYLHKKKISTIYSITEAFNYPAISMKKKTGGITILSGVHFNFFKKVDFRIKLGKHINPINA